MSLACTSSAELELLLIARELAAVRERLCDLTATARSLCVATDWQSEAAALFHERSEQWAHAVAALTRYGELAVHATQRARVEAAARAARETGCF